MLWFTLRPVYFPARRKNQSQNEPQHRKKLYICFINYSKAFDCVHHDKLWSALEELGAPAHLIKLIRALYTDQEVIVRIRFGDTEWLKIKKRTKQDCILSPLLYNLYTEVVMRRTALDESNAGVRTGGRTINNLRYAGDTTLLAENGNDLTELIWKLKAESEKMGLALNVKKTKIMSTEEKKIGVRIEGEEVEVVDSCIFLGSLIVSSGVSAPEIKRRIALGRTVMVGMNQIWRCRDADATTKRRLVTAMVFPIMTYGRESWTLTKTDRRKIEAFELWCWRRRPDSLNRKGLQYEGHGTHRTRFLPHRQGNQTEVGLFWTRHEGELLRERDDAANGRRQKETGQTEDTMVRHDQDRH